MSSEPKSSAYKDAGVDIEAGAEAVEAIRQDVESTFTPEVVGSIGGFGGLFSAAAFKDMEDPLLVSGTDGVGTKLELAKRSGRLTTVGIDLVAMCANDIVCCGARPLFFLDYLAVGRLEPTLAASLVKGIAAGCREAGCALIGGEMAEHPGIMAADDFDLSGFCVGVVDRPKMIGPDLVEEGDAIIGVASSGFHSNGYSLIRKALTNDLSDEELLGAKLANGQPLIDALLEPTRLYVQPLLSTLEAGLAVHAVAHITGGGITFNLDRALPVGLDAQVQLGSWETPPVMLHLAQAANLDTEDLLKTFNMGIGFAVICKQGSEEAVFKHFEPQGAFHIGRVVKATNPDAPGKVVYVEGGFE
ncbi:MAG: phosphoribosylformylglycinamidine cyclo-ligase [Coriobacteriia bacterium]|nr:phosphoribosylformylglycinamidine cyclo-ligase [Coriobacteriia bacterium]MCL2749940.1 phosphoribosylformylglycinamidine cyclo-ligase [Coriobacteriia bacterium]